MSGKKIRYHQVVESKKQTKQEENPDKYNNMRAAWRFARAVGVDRKWSIYKNDREAIEPNILTKLKELEKQTWQEIKSSPTHKSHFIEVNDFIKDAKDELNALKIYEDALFSLRLTGKQRIFGFLEKGVLDILWYDPEHQICPSTKK